MAALPSGTQVAGSHITTYESLFRQVDKNGTGKIGAAEAALFLKKSGLKETLLHKIWELSDPLGRGFLDKEGMFVALKLIALAQSGQEVVISNLTLQASIPNMSGTTSAAIPRPATPPTDNLWAITPEEKAKFDNIFNGLIPVDNKLTGDKVKTVFMNSKLPVDVLSRIWDLSDIDKDGLLDREEFAVAMYLVYKALEKEPTPMVLPPRLLPPSKRKKPAPLPGAVPVLPGPASAASLRGRATPPIPVLAATVVKEGSPKGSPTLQPKQPLGHSTWVVTAQEKANFDMVFKTLDTNNDGLVSGEEVRPTLVQSGLQQGVLAHIWNLCDMKQAGQLNSEQFALAMYLIQLGKTGVPPPQQLTSEMIPPTSRPKPSADQGLAGLDLGAPGGPTSGISENISEAATAAAAAGDFEAIKELDAISKEIESLKHEKGGLQEDITDKEEQMTMKSLEVKGLQIELDQASLQVKQLETQKTEAQKRLDELDQQKATLENLLVEVKEQCRDLQTTVDDMKIKVSSQETSVKAQEDELNTVRIELNNLRQEEVKLEKELDTSKGQLNTVIESVNASEQELQQLEAKLSVLRDGKQKMSESISQYDSAIDTASSTGSLPNVDDLGPIANGSSYDSDMFSSRATAGSSSPVSTLSEFSIASKTDDFKDDPFKSKDPFGGETVDAADPFQTSDPFKGDPFKTEGFTSDPFGGDPFKETFKTNDNADPFQSTTGTAISVDPFQGTTGTAISADPFQGTTGTADPFAGGTDSTDFFKGADPFTNSDKSDPFKTTEGVADPFKTSTTSDPFNSTVGLDLFKSSDGADPFQTTSTVDPFKGSDDADPFKSSDGADLFKSKSSDGADLFKTKDGSDPFQQSAGSDPFTSTTQEDPFKSGDPFGGGSGGGGGDPFGTADPFKSSDPFQGEIGASLTNGQTDGKPASNDPFGSIDPFGGDAFQGDAFSKTSSSTDTFGIDPFRDPGDTPTLPPKKNRATVAVKAGTTSPISSSTTAPSNSDAFAAFGSDAGADPFASTAGADTTKSSADPFGGQDPFGGSTAATDSGGGFGGQDPFGGGSITGGTDTGFGVDPFGGGSTTGGTDSAFGGQDPFGGPAATTTTSGGKDGGTTDAFANFADFGNTKFEMTEEEQLAWAVKDSEKERERQHRLAQQEQDDLQKALSLSQVDAGSSDA